MRKMKDSGIDWIDSIPEHWKVDKFKSKFSFGKGLNITKENLTTTGTKVISYGQIHSKANKTTYIDGSLYRFVSNDYVEAVPSALVSKGDIIFADTSEDYAGIGNCVHIDVDGEDIFAGYHTVIAHPETDENSRYLSYLFLTDCWRSQIRSSVSGIKVFSITQKILRQLSVILPPVEEQNKITAFLDDKCSQLDEIITKQQQVIKKLNAYKLSVITEAVTKGLNPDVPMKDSGITWIGKIPESYTITKLKYLTNSIIDGTHATPTYVPDGIPFLRVTDITNAQNTDSQIDLNNVVRIPVEEHNELIKRCKPEKGDLLVSKNGTIGIPKVVDWDWEFSIFVSLCLLKLRDNIDAKYLMYYFKSSLVDYEIAINGKKGTITNLHLEKIRNFNIPCPNMDMQKQVVDYLDKKCAAIDESIAKRQQLIEKLTEYKKSLIFEVVTGKKEV